MESKNDYSHSESSDGTVVTGSYSVVLPDTRTQIVTYKGDNSTGYVADVKYQGEAKYPEPKAASYPPPANSAKKYWITKQKKYVPGVALRLNPKIFVIYLCLVYNKKAKKEKPRENKFAWS